MLLLLLLLLLLSLLLLLPLLLLPIRIAKLDRRIGNCTVLACNKWAEIFKECENSLGVSGDATNDVFLAWNRLASDAFHRRNVPLLGRYHPRGISMTPPGKRSNSLIGLHGRTVKVPVQLIPLERARALTSAASSQDDNFIASIRNSASLARKSLLAQQFSAEDCSIVNAPIIDGADLCKPDISRPINLEESTFCCSYPSGLSYRVPVAPYAPQADFSDGGGGMLGLKSSSSSDLLHQSDMEMAVGPKDVREGIQNYVDKAFNTPDHPLGMLMNRLELVYRMSYAGIGASKFLLPHAIAETHSIIQRMHGIVRFVVFKTSCCVGIRV